MATDGKTLICQRTITLSKVIKTTAQGDGVSHVTVSWCIDGIMDFSLNEHIEMMHLLHASIKDIKENLYNG